jgi:hypothetical protein
MLCFVKEWFDAPVVVWQLNHWGFFQVRSKDPLAVEIKVIAIHKCLLLHLYRHKFNTACRCCWGLRPGFYPQVRFLLRRSLCLKLSRFWLKTDTLPIYVESVDDLGRLKCCQQPAKGSVRLRTTRKPLPWCFKNSCLVAVNLSDDV